MPCINLQRVALFGAAVETGAIRFKYGKQCRIECTRYTGITGPGLAQALATKPQPDWLG